MTTCIRIRGFVGAALLLLTFTLLWGTNVAHAQDLPPRPTTIPTVAPTAAPRPAPGEEETAATLPGRITGTVIDQTSGAPTAGIAVQVGDVTVFSDANGNYGRDGLVPGTYIVAVQPSASQGVTSEAPAAVLLESGATVIQHVAFRSPAPAAITPLPTTAPVEVVQPAQLPSTGAPISATSQNVYLALTLLAGGFVLRCWTSRKASASKERKFHL
jgi:hypothetical protein